MSYMKRFEVWFYGLLAGGIGGGATSLVSWFGMTAAKAVGLDVPTLNLKAMGVIFCSGALTNIAAYLAKSPLPPPSDGTTAFFTKKFGSTDSIDKPEQKDDKKP
jgi:hypothetical protein